MADEKRTLEMRVAELEDKLAQLHISEEEMQTYHKVASKLGAAAPGQHCIAAQQQQPCIAAQQQPSINQIYPYYYRCYYYRCYYYNCYYYNDCIQATGQPGPGGGGGGFGGFGT